MTATTNEQNNMKNNFPKKKTVYKNIYTSQHGQAAPLIASNCSLLCSLLDALRSDRLWNQHHQTMNGEIIVRRCKLCSFIIRCYQHRVFAVCSLLFVRMCGDMPLPWPEKELSRCVYKIITIIMMHWILIVWGEEKKKRKQSKICASSILWCSRKKFFCMP